ncbi:hypothetical protein V8G54_032131 [Vigna mungo]|uniref:Uncharacterized protein n=1 Tax=Vigna mungo TaxID=3915 RepID=A0AAQ3RHK5_VIGMU
MVNVKGDAAKEGVVYDVAEDAWKDMLEGMLYGWRGPVAAMEEELMYVVDEAKGVLRRDLAEEDASEEILENERLKGAEQLAAKKGKLCVVSTSGISVVDVAASLLRIIPVVLSEGFEILTAAHNEPQLRHPHFLCRNSCYRLTTAASPNSEYLSRIYQVRLCTVAPPRCGTLNRASQVRHLSIVPPRCGSVRPAHLPASDLNPD